jgi:hypothetical protein
MHGLSYGGHEVPGFCAGRQSLGLGVRDIGLGWCPADPGDCVKLVKDAINLVVDKAKAFAKAIGNLPSDFATAASDFGDILKDVISVIGSLPDPQRAWEKFKQLVKDVGKFAFEVWAD